ncbi:MAG: GNAT family N-acetyltransferase [Patescibacteria group bacterium UBA2103]
MEDHIIVVRGKTVDLAVVQEMYIPEIMHMINDPRVAKFITARPPIYPAEETEWLKNLEKNKNDVVFAVLLKKPEGGHEFLGIMGTHIRPKTNGVAVTGAILKYDCLGKGYGSEAKMLQLFYAFRFLGLNKIRSTVLSINPRSKRYLEKAGYKVTGAFKDEDVRDGVPCDEIQLELFPKEWEEIWKNYKKKHNMKDPF